MPFPRATGILLHPTSLPSRGGIGDLGPAAYEFLDFLADARQGLWQVLPLSPIGVNHSPYSSTSAFAGNPLLISLERLADRGWIARDRVAQLPDGQGPIDYDRVRNAKLPLLREAAANFLSASNGGDRKRFQDFSWLNGWWLEDYVLFEVLHRRHDRHAWNTWPAPLARRESQALESARKELAAELDIERVIQFAFFEQWRALRAACHARGVRIVGDVAIFVNLDSADVWTHPDIFRMDAVLQPEVVSGVPPDAFSATGQRWGNPLYRWDVLRARQYDWWVQRMRWALAQCDIIRLDHFRGFEGCWEIPASEATAVHGRWIPGPGDDLFNTLRGELGDLPFIAEDLGLITAEVHALRERLGIPGMRVLQFGFGDPGAHIYLPHRYEPNTVVYTGTHDNDTTIGWWHSRAEAERRAIAAYLSVGDDGIHWAMIRAAMTSVAEFAIVPLQDVLGLGSDARMNTPSRADQNWAWRFNSGALTPALAQKLAALAEVSDRLPLPSVAGEQGDREMREEFAA
jgi:4-alpha-glucanotransferase